MSRMTPWSAETPVSSLTLDARVYFRTLGKADMDLPLFSAVYYIHSMAARDLDFEALDADGLQLACFSRGRFNASPDMLNALAAMKTIIEREDERFRVEYGIASPDGQ